MKLLDGEVGTIFMMEHRNFRRAYTTNPTLLPITPRKRGNTYKAYKTKKPLILSAEEITKIHPQIAPLKIKYDLMVPLMNRGKSIGVMSIMSKKKRFSEKHLEILAYFTPLASLAIRKAQLYEELDKALRTRDLFISMAAHELRTPVTTMYVYTQMLKKKSAKGQKLDSEWVDNLLYEMARLTKLIDELLQVNQIKTGNLRYEFEEVDVDHVIKMSLKTFEASHKGSRINYKNDSKRKPIIVADPNKIEQVLINLLDNSEKHNEWKKPISIFLSTDRKDITVWVIDEGSGISKEDLDRVFEEFYKGAEHTKAGMGLGLYLIKKIIDEHKGTIRIRSMLGKGTTVIIKLPLAKYGRR
jgi:K+-sensing histidine kinase KdpD